MTDLTNSLADLAERIKESHAAFLAAQRMTADKALETGRLLCRAKDECKHGEWLPLLDRAGVGERWAQHLMKIARAGIKSETVTALGGIKATLKVLADFRLPTHDEVLVVSVDNFDQASNEPMAILWPSSDHRGFYHFASIDSRDDGVEVHFLGKPTRAAPILMSNGEFVSGVWLAIEQFAKGKFATFDMQIVPADVAAEYQELVQEAMAA
ncbi:hypothetical protein GGQ99_005062 [Aminobacter niigataensis]|uniref:DUF3102 domain-containing protein n=1 Tax=Aminobacter niigataensis TaxID=83265 RepID=A0ABR6L8Y4_9HYPH|nr:DUF3102 domain-containing protein [Aminobacter niigataensis]MBB4653277.1 hypothetical protein [Aminobacter niigataensis]